jgi:hypothetical protein
MIRDFNDISEIKKHGFTGFKTIRELHSDSSYIPKQKGVYLVLNKQVNPSFVTNGTGGFFKGKNPNVHLSYLKDNWVNNAKVVYIGKSGSSIGKATLYSRLNQYFSFGQGKNVGHWGGRLIWQLANAKDLIVCWKTLPDDEPREVETLLIQKFVEQFGKRPFANLCD